MFSVAIKSAMNELWGSKGRKVQIDGVVRTITSVRVVYGINIQFRLDQPLPGCTSELFDVEPQNAVEVRNALVN